MSTQPKPMAWHCQCGKSYEVTCISSKPPKKEWVGLTDEEIETIANNFEEGYVFLYRSFARAIEAKLKERNT
jgi:hypothetical protein